MRKYDAPEESRRPAIPYLLVTRDEEIPPLRDHLVSIGCRRLAIDVESEHNLHRYGIHVSLIQLFDGERAWLVDALAIRHPTRLAPLLVNAPWTLVWFDAVSDLLSIRHSLGLKPSPILDLALAARLLGKEGGLHALTPRVESASAKERLQRANWMRRPLPQSMIEYAVADVAGLFPLADALMAELEEKGLAGEFKARNLAIQEEERSWDPFSNYTRVPGFKYLRAGGKRLARLLWYARELYAKKRDMPSGNAATKEELRLLVDRGLHEAAAIVRFLNKHRKRNQIDPDLFAASLREAERMLSQEPEPEVNRRSRR